ncbi:hypothetical protein JCM3766R1_002149 [Sporobolomyces carnicolor]
MSVDDDQPPQQDPPETPRPRSRSRNRSSVLSKVPGAPNPERQRKFLRFGANERAPELPAHEVLLEHLYRCKPIAKHSAKVNARAAAEGYDLIGWKVETWESEVLHDHQTLDHFFKDAVVNYSTQLAAGKIARWVKIKKNGDEVDYSLKVPLVVVEDKAPGIVRGEDWDPYPKHPHASEHNWMSRLMPQLFMYADLMGCYSLFITNYNHTYGVRIDERDLKDAVGELTAHGQVTTKVRIQVRLATEESDRDGDNKDAYDFGFRPALAYEVFRALFNLGVADHTLVDKHLPQGELRNVDDTPTKKGDQRFERPHQDPKAMDDKFRP